MLHGTFADDRLVNATVPKRTVEYVLQVILTKTAEIAVEEFDSVPSILLPRLCYNSLVDRFEVGLNHMPNTGRGRLAADAMDLDNTTRPYPAFDGRQRFAVTTDDFVLLSSIEVAVAPTTTNELTRFYPAVAAVDAVVAKLDCY